MYGSRNSGGISVSSNQSYGSGGGSTHRSLVKRQSQPKRRSPSSNRISGMGLHDEQGNMIDDEPVQSFISNLSSFSSPDEWHERKECFRQLVESIPSHEVLPSVGGITPWYRSPQTLRRLHVPLSNLLADARSIVAKQVTNDVAELVESCSRVASCGGNNSGEDPCQYLLKDLLPAVMALHGQTVNIIKGYAKAMMERIIIACRFKSGLPVLLEKLRKDKSKDMREACIKYISLVITHWSGTQTGGKKNYLTLDICNHLGNGLARAMSDQSQVVRKEARIAFEFFRQKYPKLWSEIVHRPDGPVSKDMRLKKGILAVAEKAGQQQQQLNTRRSPGFSSPYHQDAQCRGGNMIKDDDKSETSNRSIGNKSYSSRFSHSSFRSSFSRSSSKIPGIGGPPNRVTTAKRGTASKSKIQPPSPSYDDHIKNPLTSIHSLSDVRRSARCNGVLYSVNSEDSKSNVLNAKDSIRELASEKIQATFRGFSVRNERVDKPPIYRATSHQQHQHVFQISQKKQGIKLTGTTAAHMAYRRKTLKHGKEPVPESPGVISFASMRSSPLTPDGEQQSEFMITPTQRKHLFSGSALSQETPSLRWSRDSDTSNQKSSPISHSRLSDIRKDLPPSSFNSDTQSTPLPNSKLTDKRRDLPPSSVNSDTQFDTIIGRNASKTRIRDLGRHRSIHLRRHMLNLKLENREHHNSAKNNTIHQGRKISLILLESHKEYIDELMENLRTEMDVVRKFEDILDESAVDQEERNALLGSSNMGPTDDEVVQYFERIHELVDPSNGNCDRFLENLWKVSRGKDVILSSSTEEIEI